MYEVNSVPRLFKSFRNKPFTVFSKFFSISHSQITKTLQLSLRNALVCIASFFLFLSSFICQNSTLLDGILPSLQSLWKCQKHPCTNTTDLYFWNTMSGLPGRPFTWILYLSPHLKSSERNILSGLVFLPLIFRITLLLFLFVQISTALRYNFMLLNEVY